MGSQGECLPRKENSVTLDPDKKDKWGIPALRIVASYGENEKAMARAMRQDIGAILNEMKLEQATPPADEISVFGKNIHECGTARMELPPHVELTVTYTEPVVRGDTSSGSVTKAATLETGMEVRVPLFVKEGDRVKVHSETREFVGRA